MGKKPAELTGIALDWAVAKCERPDWDTVVLVMNVTKGNYNPSTNWAQGGPIIEREKIELRLVADDGSAWYAHLGAKPFPADAQKIGPTPLVAAMLCYVASVLGDEVDIPDELK